MEAVETLVRQHSKELFGYLCRFVGNRSHAEDILSDVFVRLIEQYRKTGDEPFAWRPWLYRVATNCALSHLRKQKIRSFVPFAGKEDVPESVPSPQQLAEMSNEASVIRSAIEKLSHKHRSILIMHVYQEMSYEEIARTLAISLGTVKSRISEAKTKIRDILGVTNE